LPAESTFLHRSPGIMERYGAYVGAAVLAMILQSLLIAALFVQRSRRARAEEAVRKTEGLFRGLFENHAAVKLIIDPATGSIVDANQAAAAYYGWSRERLRQMRIQDINTLSPPEVEQEIQKARTLERVHFEFRHRRADGSIADVDVFSSKVDIQGKELLHSIVHDSTARKRAEEGLRESEARYRSVVTSMAEGVVVRNAAGLVTTCNPAAEEIFGIAAQDMKDHVPPNPGLKVIREDGSPFAAEEYPPMVALRTGQPQVNVVMGFHHPGGRVTWTKSNSELLRDPGGRVAGVVTTIADITERRALREQLTVASRLAAMGTLVAGVAHEINNPLAGEMASQEMAIREVMHFAELLRRGDPIDSKTLASRVAEVIEMLGDAQAGSRRIAAIVKDLSVFGRSDRTRSPVHLSSVVESAMRRLPPSARTAATIRVESGPAPEVLASTGQLEQVIENLVTNAALALPAGRQGEITVRTGPGRPGMARLDVTDNGIGIAPEVVDRIFDPFFSTRDVGKGMGLGLSISHAIVAAHGGTLTVASVAGMGSTFRIELPAAGAP
jgi:two-component system cell cycle sensor histidine kinase/response regulator CckA